MHNVVRIGYTGIEPVNYGFRVHCLTIWLIPNKELIAFNNDY